MLQTISTHPSIRTALLFLADSSLAYALSLPSWAFSLDIKLLDRFLDSIEENESGCWIWKGFHYWHGYGRFVAKGRHFYAHRFFYESFCGKPLAGMEIDHLCQVRNCVNWFHLECVSHRENMLRGNTLAAINAQKTHCKNGHEFNEKNTHQTRDGKRRCRVCDAEKKRLDRLQQGRSREHQREFYRTRTHCKNGHTINEQNTYINKQGSLICRACDRMRRPKKNSVYQSAIKEA